MQEWADCWGMAFNKDKCKVMHFGRGNTQHQYQLGGHVLSKTVAEKDSLVMVTNDQKPENQCARVAKTAMTVLGQIKRSFKYRDKKVFPALSKDMLGPILSSPARHGAHGSRRILKHLKKYKRGP
jgi:ribonucleases P/MRP protein subunit RPP40